MAPQPAHSASSLEALNPELFAAAFGESYHQEMDEESLTLHVWTPDEDPIAPRPIMVWLHGGGFDHGTSATPRTDGSSLAREQGVVVVSVTHRLGALGYAYLDEIDPAYAGSANVGLLDIVAALQWIAANAVAFGGDASNVTLFGESGGGCKITSLMAAPAARGLFHKAIVQSGPFAEPPTPAEATETARALLAELQLDDGAPLAPQFESVAAADVAEAQERLVSSGRLGGLAFSPVLDGVTLTSSQFDAVTNGDAAALPVLIGFNENEWGSFASGDPSVGAIDEERLRTLVGAVAGDASDDLLTAYRNEVPGASPAALWVRMVSHRILALSTWDVVEARSVNPGAGPTFSYLFTWTSPSWPEVGSFHGIEGGFVFDTTDAIPLAADDRQAAAVAERTSSAWARFARSGNPSVDGEPAPSNDHTTLVFGPGPELVADPFGRIRGLWRRADRQAAEGGESTAS